MTEPTTRVLHILGIDDTNRVTVVKLAQALHPRDLSYLGNVEVLNLLDDKSLLVETVVCGGMEGADLHINIPDVVLSAICDPDTNRKSLDVAARIVGTLNRPVVNPPAAIRGTSRDQVADLLSIIPELVVPKTVRFTPRRRADVIALVESGEMSLPFLMRPAGDHGGKGLRRVDDLDDPEALDAFALDGSAFYATAFHDFSSSDGLFRKMRVIVVGGVPHPRHLIVSNVWNIHSESRDILMKDDASLRAQEEKFLEGFDPKAWPVFEQIGAMLGLDYFGVDFAIDHDEHIVIFEVNACVRALGTLTGNELPYHVEALRKIKAALVDLLKGRAAGTL